MALDRALRDGEGGAAEVDERYEALTVLYLRTHPQTDHAANLLLKRASQGGLPDEEAIKVLLSVARDSQVYEQSRRQAARLLYRVFRVAGEADKAFASARFVKVAEELLGLDRRAAMDQKDGAAKEAAGRLLTTARQLLDALLSVPTPDVMRAEGVLATIQSVQSFNNSGAGEHEPELVYRRLQMNLARDDEPAAAENARRLRVLEGGKRFADSAERLMYQRAVAQWLKVSAEMGVTVERRLESARKVIEHGERVIEQVGSSPTALANAAVLTVHRTVAKAAVDVWREANENEALQLAMRLDRLVLAANPATADSLERLAQLAEASGDRDTALDCWKRLGAGLEPGTAQWLQARYETARLLVMRDPGKAALLLAQHQVLYPTWGEEPWGSKLKALYEQVKDALPAPVPAREGKP